MLSKLFISPAIFLMICFYDPGHQIEWAPNYSIQVGYSILIKDNKRLGIDGEYYSCKVNPMEFSDNREEYLGIALWFDF